MGAVVDYSWARPSPRSLRERGYTGAMRYLSYERGKNLSASERDALWAEGIAVGLVWETVASRPLSGFAGGQADGAEANRQAGALGFPGHVPIAYAVDFDPAGKLAVIEAYFRGVLSAGGRPLGVYGAYDVIEHLAGIEQNGRRVTCFWQCAGWSGFGTGSGGAQPLDVGKPRRRSRHACLYQDIAETRAKGEDHNHVLGHVEFLYHPDQTQQATDPPLEEDPHMAKIVFCPEHTGGVGWLTLPNMRRLGLSNQTKANVALKVGDADGLVELRGDEAWEYLNDHYETPLHALHWGAVELMTTGVERNTEATGRIVTEALKNLDAPDLPAGFATEVAARVLAEVGSTVEDAAARGVDRELDGQAD